MANIYPAGPRGPAVVDRDPEPDQEPMPTGPTNSIFLVVSGFGIGALVVLAAFVFLIGLGDFNKEVATPATPAAQSAAGAPAAPGPQPHPTPNTAGSAVPQTTGQAPAPANPNTPRAPTQQQQQQQQK